MPPETPMKLLNYFSIFLESEQISRFRRVSSQFPGGQGIDPPIFFFSFHWAVLDEKFSSVFSVVTKVKNWCLFTINDVYLQI